MYMNPRCILQLLLSWQFHSWDLHFSWTIFTIIVYFVILLIFMYSVQPSFHKISISTPKKVNGLISWGDGCKKRVGGNLKTFTEGIIDFSWCTPLVYDIVILLLWDTFINILLCEVKKITVLHTCKLWFTKFEISWIVLVLWTDFKNKNHAIKLLANVVAMF